MRASQNGSRSKSRGVQVRVSGFVVQRALPSAMFPTHPNRRMDWRNILEVCSSARKFQKRSAVRLQFALEAAHLEAPNRASASRHDPRQAGARCPNRYSLARTEEHLHVKTGGPPPRGMQVLPSLEFTRHLLN